MVEHAARRAVGGEAAEAGLDYRLANARPVNSFDVHRLLHLGEHRGRGDALRERLMRAYTAEGADLGDRATLGDAVRADEALARRFGIRAVPSVVFDSRYAASGALPVAELAALLEQAWQHATDQTSGGHSRCG